jgi:hypothetical protein
MECRYENLSGFAIKTQTPLRTGPVLTGFVQGRMLPYYLLGRLEKPEFKLRSP